MPPVYSHKVKETLNLQPGDFIFISEDGRLTVHHARPEVISPTTEIERAVLASIGETNSELAAVNHWLKGIHSLVSGMRFDQIATSPIVGRAEATPQEVEEFQEDLDEAMPRALRPGIAHDALHAFVLEGNKPLIFKVIVNHLRLNKNPIQAKHALCYLVAKGLVIFEGGKLYKTRLYQITARGKKVAAAG